jgi:hypothetical protein
MTSAIAYRRMAAVCVAIAGSVSTVDGDIHADAITVPACASDIVAIAGSR